MISICGLVVPYGVWVSVNTGSCFGFLPGVTKPSDELMLISSDKCLGCSIQGNVYLNIQYISPQLRFDIGTFKITNTSDMQQ